MWSRSVAPEGNRQAGQHLQSHQQQPLHPTLDQEHNRRLAQRCLQHNYVMRPSKWIASDGDCMFEALADQMLYTAGHELQDYQWAALRAKESIKMRKTVASWLLSNGNIAISLDPEAEAAAGTLGSDDSMLLKNFYAPSPYHRNWKQYCDRLADARASPVEEGDHLALIGAANALSRHIIIISSIAGDQYFTKVSPSTIPGLRIANANQPLRLCHWQEAHYSSLTTMPEEAPIDKYPPGTSRPSSSLSNRPESGGYDGPRSRHSEPSVSVTSSSSSSSSSSQLPILVSASAKAEVVRAASRKASTSVAIPLVPLQVSSSRRDSGSRNSRSSAGGADASASFHSVAPGSPLEAGEISPGGPSLQGLEDEFGELRLSGRRTSGGGDDVNHDNDEEEEEHGNGDYDGGYVTDDSKERGAVSVGDDKSTNASRESRFKSSRSSSHGLQQTRKSGLTAASTRPSNGAGRTSSTSTSTSTSMASSTSTSTAEGLENERKEVRRQSGARDSIQKSGRTRDEVMTQRFMQEADRESTVSHGGKVSHDVSHGSRRNITTNTSSLAETSPDTNSTKPAASVVDTSDGVESKRNGCDYTAPVKPSKAGRGECDKTCVLM